MQKSSSKKSKSSSTFHNKILIIIENGTVEDVYISPGLRKRASIAVIDHDYHHWNSSSVKEIKPLVFSSSAISSRFSLIDPFNKIIRNFLHKIWNLSNSSYKTRPVEIWYSDRLVMSCSSVKEAAKSLNVSAETIRKRLNNGKPLKGFTLKEASYEN